MCKANHIEIYDVGFVFEDERKKESLSEEDVLWYRLSQVKDTYLDFIYATSQYARKNASRFDRVMEYLKKNPKALSSDILEFISNQPDFYEDYSYYDVNSDS